MWSRFDTCLISFLSYFHHARLFITSPIVLGERQVSVYMLEKARDVDLYLHYRDFIIYNYQYP